MAHSTSCVFTTSISTPAVWLPSVLQRLAGISASDAKAATTYLMEKLFKPTDDSLREVVAAGDGAWRKLVGKLCKKLQSLADAAPRADDDDPPDMEELVPVLSTAMASALDGTPPPDTPPDSFGGASPPTADSEANEHTTFLRLGLEWAQRTTGGHWTGEVVYIDDGQRVGHSYKAGRAGRGDGPKAPSPFAVPLEEEAHTRGTFELDDEEKVADRKQCEWRPPQYGGKDVMELSEKLRAEIAFYCECNPKKQIKIGSLSTHRQGKKCISFFVGKTSFESSVLNSAARARDPAITAAAVRASSSPVLSVPPRAADTIHAAFRRVHSDAAAAAAVASPVAGTPKAPSGRVTHPLSGSQKRKAAAAKASKKQRWLDERLAERREAEEKERRLREKKAMRKVRKKAAAAKSHTLSMLREIKDSPKAVAKATRRALLRLYQFHYLHRRHFKLCRLRRNSDVSEGTHPPSHR